MTLPVTPQAAFAATLVDEWVRAGVTDAVVAPGSRSTPLTLALAAVEDRIRVHVILDERSAGFFALGTALSSGRPAPVITTSGTAAGHLLPAVMEAHAARVPMLLCTADRPPELHHVGAPQTAEQAFIYGNFVRFRQTVDSSLPAHNWRSIAARSLIEAQAGPVHLNVEFRDPLIGDPGDLVPDGRAGNRAWHVASASRSGAVPLSTHLSGRTGLIVASSGISDPACILETAATLGWPVLAGPRSGCRGVGIHPAVVVAAFDAILRRRDAPRPEVVLRLGGLPTSKVTNAWLDELDADQVVADPFGQWVDPGRTAREFVAATPEAVCRSLIATGPAAAPDGWAAAWRSAESTAQQTIETVLAAQSHLSEPQVARTVTRHMPADATLVVASSMPIRDVEWYGDPSMTVRVLSNRGVNGIDGTISTALGVATGGPVVALMGDLAFLHDAGALLGAEGDCTLVVIDNGGGGIFNFLPQAAALPSAVFERYFGTPHGVDLAALASGYGVAVEVAETPAALRAAISRTNGVRMVLVRTDRAANVAVHEELAASVVAALDS